MVEHYDTFRREYIAGGLDREMLDACPIRQFEGWLEQAVKAGLKDPTGMVLATVDEGVAITTPSFPMKVISAGLRVMINSALSGSRRNPRWRVPRTLSVRVKSINHTNVTFPGAARLDV